MFDLTGTTALVTGGGRGLGRTFAKALAEAGARIIVTSRRSGGCNVTVEEIRDAGGTVHTYQLETTSMSSIRRLREDLERDGLLPNVLVNNAGCNVRKPMLEITEEDWDSVVDVNLKGSFFVSQAFLPPMIERRHGRIINIGSVTSVFGYAGIAPYCASRGGILQLTRSMADEFGPHGVTVNVLAPGWFETDQNRILYENQAWVDYLVDRIPVKRPGVPDDLKGAVVFLASEESRYVTGQILLVDGGITTGATKATLDS